MLDIPIQVAVRLWLWLASCQRWGWGQLLTLRAAGLRASHRWP